MLRVYDKKTKKIYYVEVMHYYSENVGELILSNPEKTEEENKRSLKDIEFLKNSYIKSKDGYDIHEKEIVTCKKDDGLYYGEVKFDDYNWIVEFKKVVRENKEEEEVERTELLLGLDLTIVGDISNDKDKLVAHGIRPSRKNLQRTFTELKGTLDFPIIFTDIERGILKYDLCLTDNIVIDVLAQTADEYDTYKELKEYVVKTYNHKLRNLNYNEIFDSYYSKDKENAFELVKEIEGIKEKISKI